MNIARIRLLGSPYTGLFAITNDTLTFVPPTIEDKALKTLETTLNTKVVKTTIYASSLLAVFAKMNNKRIYLPSYITSPELTAIEHEIKATILTTDNALGNMIEVNDTGAIVSKTLHKSVVEDIKKSGLAVLQTNIAKTDVVGSCIVATSRGFVVNPNITREDATAISQTLGVQGGSSTANTGDTFIRNSVIANKHGIIMGESTTPFEINRIEEALEGAP